MKDFNVKGFVSLCRNTQYDLMEYLGKQMGHIYGIDNVKKTEDYIFCKGDLPVALISHLDTVHDKLPKTIWYDYESMVVKSEEGIGGDDRCGVYAVLYILNNLKQGKPSVLFTMSEEIGCLGAKKAVDDLKKDIKNINFLVELDRKGYDDAVFYKTENEKFEKHILKFGFKKQIGQSSDIAHLSPAWGMASVNLSVGYYNPHTVSEYVNGKELIETCEKVLKIVEDSINTKKFKFCTVTKKAVVTTSVASTKKDTYNCYDDNYKIPPYQSNNNNNYLENQDFWFS